MNKPGRRSKIAVGSQSRRATRLSRNRESESLGENARCGVTVTRVSVSEPSRREKEPERGSFGAKQRIKKEEERKGKRNQSKCLERIRSSHRAQPGHTMTERSFSSFSVLCCREYCLVPRGTRANLRFPNGKSVTRDRVDGESGSN